MKAKKSFSKKEMETFTKFPVIGAHQVAVNMLSIIRICKDSIAKNNQHLIDVLERPSPLTPQEQDEYLFVIDELSGHIVFCERALYEARSQLKDIACHLN